MAKLLKGNYRLARQKGRSTAKKPKKDLTARFEESALAKLGGSLCFVMKGNFFVWKGEEDDGSGKETR